MANSFRIGIEPVRVEVNDHLIEFFPDDVSFMDGYYNLANQAREMQKKYNNTQKKLSQRKAKGDDAHVQDIEDMTGYYKECCDNLQGSIDSMFGTGTCTAVFGGHKILVNYIEFLDKIGDFINFNGDERYEKYKKYAKPSA